MNRRGKVIDTSNLTITAAHGQIHRDYLAHCLRWSHVVKFMAGHKRHRTAHVLDVGCGVEVPLARAMYTARLTHTTGSYTGVDHGRLPWPRWIKRDSARWHMTLHERSDFATVSLDRRHYDVVVSFEMLEHVEPAHAFVMLHRMRNLVGQAVEGGTVFISTPCYDSRVGAAGNHVNEMSYDGFHALLQLAGLRVEGVWGTFASQRDYRQTLSECYPGINEAFDALRAYYDPDVLACLFAPLVPEHARNCLWRVNRTTPTTLRPKTLKQLATPRHGSSAEWSKTLKQLNQEVSRVQR
jgi:SAM-dependent methyltransferase